MLNTNSKPVALITGASRGIGLAIATRLHQEGYVIAGVSRSISRSDIIHMAIESDIQNIDQHRDLVDQVAEEYGRIDLLVNNAGVAPAVRKDLLEADPSDFDRLMNINLRGPFFLTGEVAKFMLANQNMADSYQPKIIFITSVSATTSSPERPAYCISKAGLSMVAQLYADRLASSGIHVYELRPGIIMTDMTRGVKEKYDKLIAEGITPQKRWGTPEDVASAVAALAGYSFNFSTGAIIEVSGGMNFRRL